MTSIYCCKWCKKRLHPQKRTPWEWLIGLGIVRRFRCPHCFTNYYRPISLWGYDLDRD